MSEATAREQADPAVFKEWDAAEKAWNAAYRKYNVLRKRYNAAYPADYAWSNTRDRYVAARKAWDDACGFVRLLP
jgi:hypothetical protein